MSLSVHARIGAIMLAVALYSLGLFMFAHDLGHASGYANAVSVLFFGQ